MIKSKLVDLGWAIARLSYVEDYSKPILTRSIEGSFATTTEYEWKPSILYFMAPGDETSEAQSVSVHVDGIRALREFLNSIDLEEK